MSKKNQESSGVISVVKLFWTSLGYETGFPLGYFLVSDPGTPVGHQIVVDNTPRSKVRYPEFVGYPSRYMFVVPPLVSRLSFMTRPYGFFHTLHQHQGCKVLFHETKGNSEF